MSSIEKNHRSLRDFGLVIGIALVLFSSLPPVLRGANPSTAGISLGLGIGVLGFAFPSSLRIPYAVWMRVGSVLGYINTRILLALLFYGVVTPLAFFKKALESRRAKGRTSVESFRIPAKVRIPQDMEYPF